jgi:hypothetical protein
MMRTTIDLDEPILRELKRVQRQENKTLGQLVSELVAAALAARRKPTGPPASFTWLSRPMQARVDLRDKEALFAAMDGAKSERP